MSQISVGSPCFNKAKNEMEEVTAFDISHVKVGRVWFDFKSLFNIFSIGISADTPEKQPEETPEWKVGDWLVFISDYENPEQPNKYVRNNLYLVEGLAVDSEGSLARIQYSWWDNPNPYFRPATQQEIEKKLVKVYQALIGTDFYNVWNRQ